MSLINRNCDRNSEGSHAGERTEAEPPTRFTDADEAYMQLALQEAAQAAADGDVPVGAILISRATGEILARGHNTREAKKTALGHAEMNAIAEACSVLESWRLNDCTLYVTLEPCPMCAGAILNARIPRVVYGTADPVAGAMGSVWALHRHPMENRHTTVECGCCEAACREELQVFFRNQRTTDNGRSIDGPTRDGNDE